MDENRAKKPLIWLLLGEKLGDNAQVELVAENLALPTVRKQLVVREPWRLGKPGFEAELHHIDLEASDPLEAPWPDLIMTVGRRPAMAALWVKEQSGGHTEVVLFGRPKKWMEEFRLIVAPAQYGIPPAPNVVPIRLPLMRVAEERVQAGKEEARDLLGDLPRPLTAVLVGGRTKPYHFGAKEVRRLIEEAKSLMARDGGSVYFTTSRRTTADVLNVLRAELPPGAHLHCFGDTDAKNPYGALLAVADRFIVTGDSISMMVEVARLGRPMSIYELPREGGVLGALLGRLAFSLSKPGLAGFLGMALFRLGLLGFSRDLSAIHRRLYEIGAARPLDEGFSPGGQPVPHEGAEVARRIREVMNLSPDPERMQSC